MMRRFLYLLPVLVFTVLVVFFVRRLILIEEGHAANAIPSAMIDKPMPDFSLPNLQPAKPNVSSADLRGQVMVVNIFASWCPECRAEHPLLSEIKSAGIKLVGITYKDKPEKMQAYLDQAGNPYDVVGVDPDGRAAINYGAYGVPESYLIDKQGIIRFKQVGPWTEEDLRTKLIPMAKELSK